jgi:TP53 regulating kinase-like protein
MKDYISEGLPDYEKESAMHQAMSVATAIGSIVAKMHNIHVIHGDLTTSNFIIRGSANVNNESSPCLFLIDFGLALTGCTNPEEKAVDLYVLERAFISSHPGSDDLLAEVMRTYKRVCSSSDSVLQRLFNVRQRGRKRDCFG